MSGLSRDRALLTTASQFKSALLNTMFGAVAAPQGVGGAQANALDAIPRGSNILGVGFGAKMTLGASYPDELAVRVYVRSKMPRAALSQSELVPPKVNGRPTDVVSVGDLAAFAPTPASPTECGVSVGHFAITAGTLGCLVRKQGDPGPDRYILSNNHVLANSASAPRVGIGDHILQPGPIDGGVDPNDWIAELSDYVPLDLSGGPNVVDAAIAKLHDPRVVLPTIRGIGPVVAPTMPASVYQSVRKFGRTTYHTIGVILDIAATIRVRYGNKIALFVDQLSIDGVGSSFFSQGGDSGSLIVDAVSRRAVGLLFAGGGSSTFANPIDDVLNHPTINAEIGL